MKRSILENDLKEIISSSQIPWQKLSGKSVLITGSNGMLASYLIETILYLNDYVLEKKITAICLSRNKEKTIKRFELYDNRKDLDFIFQDVCTPITYKNPVHYIIHAASQASPKYYGKDPVGTLEANVIGTRNLLQFAKSKEIESFLFLSTGEIYGAVDHTKLKIKEDDCGLINPLTVRACYAESKRLAETMCLAYKHQYNIPIKIARLFHTYGPSIALDDGRVYGDFIANIINNENIYLNSDGSAKRPFCYITDATVGLFLILLKGQVGEAYNLGNPDQEKSVLELAEILVTLFSERKIKVIREGKKLESGYLKSSLTTNCPDIEKIKSLGWQPTITIQEGFKRTIEALL